MDLILASNSPRRKQILALGGWEFRIQVGEVDEQLLPGEDPRQYVLRLAELKAQAAAREAGTGSCVIAADTTVVDDNQETAILAKPADAEDAAAMLRQLCGRTHQVLTGLVVINLSSAGIAIARDVVATEVQMRQYTDAEIQAYVATGDPLDKAGAYAIQHTGFHPVERINGCYANVVGLPLCALTRRLAEFGILPQSVIARKCQAAADGDPCAVAPFVMEGSLNR
ncbi:MAG TPA: Maf family protein [Anaerolineales bacterium]|nr:Maf family protein [Anaerolineales bacterium]